MRKVLLVALFLFGIAIGFSQNKSKDEEENLITYRVQLGETVRMISRRYFIAPSQIYKYNKFAVDGISEGMLLYIPVPKKEVAYVEETTKPETASKPVAVNKGVVASKPTSIDKNDQVISSPETSIITHTVQNQETLYGLSKKYNITVDELKKQNPLLVKNGMQVGQVLTIQKNNNIH